MPATATKDRVADLLEERGTTYAEEAGIRVERGTPSELFRLLVLSILLSARIRSSIAVEAARQLFEQGWTTPQKMCDAGWQRRVNVINRSGYARYDERTSSMLGDTSQLLLDRWGGDLRRLRDEADRDPKAMRKLLKEFKGMGDVGVDIFFREVQRTWGELQPFFDKRALDVARDLDLPADPAKLAKLVDDKDVARLAAALIRARLDD